MWKSAHVRLANYLSSQEELASLNRHRVGFVIGSILPDCMPSFITRRHHLEGTLFILKREVQSLFECDKVGFSFCLHLGIVLHYIADYFTYPHNKIFHGTFFEHCRWEKEQLEYLTSCLATQSMKATAIQPNSESLYPYLQEKHEQYLKETVSFENDCRYIVEVSYYFAVRLVQAKEVNFTYNFMEGQK